MGIPAARPPYVLDARSADDVYRDAIALVRAYLPEWAGYWPGDPPDPAYFTTDDPGLVTLKLLSQLHASLTIQLNRAPDKHFLAFLDFFGMELRAPAAAEAPLAFTLASGSGPVEIPSGTQVAATSDPNLLFETTEALTALPVVPTAALCLLPAADAYRDVSELIGAAPGAGPTPLEHALYLGGAGLFQQPTALAELSITFEGVNLFADYFARWTDGSGNPLHPELELELYDTLVVSFADFSQATPSTVGGVASFWLAVRPDASLRIRAADQEMLPQIYRVTVTVRSELQQAEAAFTNNTPIDLVKGAYPFGRAPSVEDAFYIASNDVFSRVDADVTIDVEATSISPPMSVALAWEYWSGSGWEALEVVDGTEALTRPGKITFTCPVMPVAQINGRNSRWVRARIASGGYGSPAGVVVVKSVEYVVNDLIAPYVSDKGEVLAILRHNGLDFGYEYKPATYTPPYVSALKIGYVLTDRPDSMITCNAFSYAPLDVQPYLPLAEREAAYYFGFAPDGFQHARGRALSLLVVLAPDPTASAPRRPGELPIWSAHDGRTWRPLSIVDGTSGFTTTGIVRISIPESIAATSVLGRDLVWIRLSAPVSSPTSLPALIGLAPNAVDAINGVLWTDEILGSASGAPGFSVSFPRKPVLDGQEVQVLELTATPVSTTPGGPPLAASAASTETMVWVTWTEVGDLTFSTSTDRHYMMDHSSGTLTFGDGTRGMVPPKGTNNLRALRYRSGGGAKGNVPAGSLTKLQKARSQIRSVTSPVRAEGGADADTLDVLRALGPRRMKAGNRAVTAEDFATLALLSSQRVVRATAYADASGRLIVAVLPRDTAAQPTVTAELVGEVKAYVGSRALLLVAGAIDVIGPDYVPLDVEVRAAIGPSARASDVRSALEAALAAFLAPLGSPSNPGGWDFGAVVTAAAVAAALAAAPGVVTIDGVSLAGDRSTITMARNQLPAAGTVRLEVLDGG
ncbi:putative baseplate assembly protein [Sorangium sp. So ce726]|uniref:putative baseplate assembly protein n=1 Tax=Sorangium sp. So ce726 TaxID=3133319 RepID=UPI003F64264F